MATSSDGGPNGQPTEHSHRATLERAVDVSMNTAPPPSGAGMSAEEGLDAELRRLAQGVDSVRVPTSPVYSSTPGFGLSAGHYNMDGISDQHTPQRAACSLSFPSSPHSISRFGSIAAMRGQ